MTKRERLLLLYAQYRAMLLIASQLDSEDLSTVNESLEAIEVMSRREVRLALTSTEAEVDAARSKLGVRDMRQLQALVKRIEDGPKNKVAYIPRAAIEKLMEHATDIYPELTELPPHTRIGIPVGGTVNGERPEFFVLEAALFEDMAALWNLVANARQIETPRERLRSKPEVKQNIALIRATLRAAFALLEGYLAGLAADILLTKDGLSDEEQVTLSEWDSKRGRSRLRTLRDKLLQYPRIAVGAASPLLQESNCEPLRTTLTAYEQYRHALVHPTPLLLSSQDVSKREDVIMTLSADRVAQVCDAVVELIFAIDAVIGSQFGPVGHWLKRRVPPGLFDATAFS